MKKHVSARVTISDNAQKTVLMDICQRHSIEACGVLLGNIDEEGNWQIEQAYPLRNIFESPVYFEFDPEELLNVELTYPEQIVGVYHSHPGGFAAASSTDRGNMQRVNQEEQIPWVWLIVCGPFDDAFMQRAQGRIPKDAVLAYHHYTNEGLRRITILTAESREKTSQKQE
jgi:proteasome lid subunit RPN8/RPN11